MIKARHLAAGCGLAFALLVLLSGPVLAEPGAPQGFATPEQAVAALVAASRHNDPAALLVLFGAGAQDIVASGDPVADKRARAHFAERYEDAHKIVTEAEDYARLMIGKEDWPFPIPLRRQGASWRFDAAAGAQEILSRRIGRNELHAIESCRAYVEAQREFAADRQEHRQPPEYAQRFISSKGQRDGLYWDVQANEKESPIGPLMAQARAEGYDGEGGQAHKPQPYHGYIYRILTRQGMHASGGAKDYVKAGHMTGGFALIATPAKYGDSGVMTFIVNQDGIVFEKDLGPDSASLAAAITAFDPESSWKIP